MTDTIASRNKSKTFRLTITMTSYFYGTFSGQFFILAVSGQKVPRRMGNSYTRLLLETLMNPSNTSTTSAVFCFSALDAFDPPLNPPALSIRYALIPSSPVASLPTSPCESCHSSLSLIPFRVLSPMPMAVAPLFLSSGTAAVMRNYAVKDISGRCRENIPLTLVFRLQPAPTSRHYISTSIALPCSLRI